MTDNMLMNKFEETFTIKNKLGLHARAASKFVQVASRFDADIFIAKGSQNVNAKSIMGLLILAATCGSDVVISAEGPDAESAVRSVGDLIDRFFDEEE